MTIEHHGPPTTPPVVYVSDQEPGDVYLNFGNHQTFARHKLSKGAVDKLLRQLLHARLRWPEQD
jgi:hypothetical protein